MKSTKISITINACVRTLLCKRQQSQESSQHQNHKAMFGRACPFNAARLSSTASAVSSTSASGSNAVGGKLGTSMARKVNSSWHHATSVPVKKTLVVWHSTGNSHEDGHTFCQGARGLVQMIPEHKRKFKFNRAWT